MNIYLNLLIIIIYKRSEIPPIDKPTITKLKIFLGLKRKVNVIVPMGINKIATVKIIPKTLPRKTLSTFFWIYEKNCKLNIVKNKLNKAGYNASI